MSEIISQEDLLKFWHEKVRRAQKAHYAAANKSKRLYYFLGVPTVIFSALASAFIFFNMTDFKLGIPLVAAILGMLASVFSSIQTFIGPVNIEKHEISAKTYGELKRRIQLAMVSKPNDLEGWLEKFKLDWDRAAETSPLALEKFFGDDHDGN